MSWLKNVPPIARALRALQRRAQLVWSRDRSSLRGAAAFGNRAFRVAILAVRGIVAHRLGLQAAALTYYTVFAMIPTLVVALWIMKWFDWLPVVSPALPGNFSAPTGNQLFHASLAMILDAVGRTSEIAGGVVGLAALLFAVSKMFGYTERALHIIAASGERTPKFSRALAYVALLLIPPVGVAVSGLLLALLRRGRSGPLSRFLTAIPGLEIGLGVAIGFAALWLAVSLLYAAAARARVAFTSAAVGGALAALALLVVFWVFASLQIGVSHASAVGSGFFAFPVFLLWAFSSWYAVLVGAEIAVGHGIDRVLVHGAATFRLDCAGERRAGVAIMLSLTRAAEAAPDAHVTEDELARDLRLPPAIIRDLCFRMVRRGLLDEDVRGFSLRADPDSVTTEAVADAIDRDPALAQALAGQAGPAGQAGEPARTRP
jgi:membrane protein